MLSKAVREVRFLLPQATSTLKTFVAKTYPTLKAQNPHLPVLIREAQGVQPTVVLRLQNGTEVVKHVETFTDKELADLLKSA